MSPTEHQRISPVEDDSALAVSPNNPYPFLRALVAGGHISEHVEPLSAIADTVVAASRGPPPESALPGAVVYLIAMIANGLSPLRVARNVREGVQLDTLRRGPLYKRGVGSRILDAAGHIDEDELAPSGSVCR